MGVLRSQIHGLRGSPDLVAYFVLRAVSILRPGGQSGFISTKSILQGETRESSLDIMTQAGEGRIVRQVPNQPWPGDAAVVIAVLWIEKTGPEPTPRFGRPSPTWVEVGIRLLPTPACASRGQT